ncbi:MAG: PadR family transcriptional regulator [Gemmatimonadetes bacterium]|nr:PadR family transcriptional regulator [Gemmatimonadota bacterium]
MAGTERDTRGDLLRGTLEMLILQTLTHGPMHGYGIAQHLGRVSREVLAIEEGSLYPALQRLLVKGLVSAEWRKTPNNQRARYYTLTRPGRSHLGLQSEEFERFIGAVRRVMAEA